MKAIFYRELTQAKIEIEQLITKLILLTTFFSDKNASF